MKILALTTSGVRAQVGLFMNGQSSVLENPNPRQHSEWLHPAIESLLEQAGLQSRDLTGIAVDLGPGSFTGLRVGFQLAQSFAYANATPLFGCTCFEILAAGLKGHVLCAVNAYRNLAYVAELREGQWLRQPEVTTAEDLAHRLKTERLIEASVTFTGDAFEKLEALSALGISSARDYSSVESLVGLAVRAGPDLWTHDWKSKSPLYLRGSEAEERAKIK